MNDLICIQAQPVRIVPFDLGRELNLEDKKAICENIREEYQLADVSERQKAILKNCALVVKISDHVKMYIYICGIAVVVIEELPLQLQKDYKTFSIPYGENRKKAHEQLFDWNHIDSKNIYRLLEMLKKILKKNSKEKIRISAAADFENKSLSYVMTLSMFEISAEVCGGNDFSCYPQWLKNNIYALLDPSILYLEDSSKFCENDCMELDKGELLNDISVKGLPEDYERHRHINVYMSWEAVLAVGEFRNVDKEDYITLEVQLQCDWFYVYCLEKNINRAVQISKQETTLYQRYEYELDITENRLLDFDDSSIPSRILDIQKGLVKTSGLSDNITRIKREIKYILDRERLRRELNQRKYGKHTEVLLFIIAFIEIAPTVLEYGNDVYHYLGLGLNIAILLIGAILWACKNRE